MDACDTCSMPIKYERKVVQETGKKFHPECFVCSTCRTRLTGTFFNGADGRPYCATHHAEKQGHYCSACRAPVSGKLVSAANRQFHPNCFVCNQCHQRLTGQFAFENDKLYCPSCRS